MERTESAYSRNFVVTWSGYGRTPKIPGTGGRAKEKKKREEELLLSYPQLVTTLALLIETGMPVSRHGGEWQDVIRKEWHSKKCSI